MKSNKHILAYLIFCLIFASSSLSVHAGEKSFNADRSFEHLRQQVLFGPRVPGQSGHAKTKDYIIAHLRQSGFHVIEQRFSRFAPLLGQTVEFTNIIGAANPAAPEKILFSCHWDTRPIADYERNASLRQQPIPGANDGASGVAVLLELATLFKDHPSSAAVCLVFFDGEDLGDPGSSDDFCYGSRHFAANLPESCRPVRAAINIDMIGDADLSLPREGYSAKHHPALVNSVWKVGTARHPGVFKWDLGPPIFDDHMPLIEAGLPAINIIDFTYPAWHTMSDDIDKCSPASLRAVGDTLFHWVLTSEP